MAEVSDPRAWQSTENRWELRSLEVPWSAGSELFLEQEAAGDWNQGRDQDREMMTAEQKEEEAAKNSTLPFLAQETVQRLHNQFNEALRISHSYQDLVNGKPTLASSGSTRRRNNARLKHALSRQVNRSLLLWTLRTSTGNFPSDEEICGWLE